MIKLNVHEAKTHLSAYLERVARGETILLCKRNTPIAEIRPLSPRRTKRRPLGLDQGAFVVPEDFFDPLPEDMIASFNGEKR